MTVKSAGAIGLMVAADVIVGVGEHGRVDGMLLSGAGSTTGRNATDAALGAP
jgi:hypothetical protein